MSTEQKAKVRFDAIQLITALDKDEIKAMMELQDYYYDYIYEPPAEPDEEDELDDSDLLSAVAFFINDL